jgi:arylsulfatase A
MHFLTGASDPRSVDRATWHVWLVLWMVVGCLVGCVVPLKRACADEAPRQPNILLIMTDDQGFWDFRTAGNSKIDTPGMDRLAAEGVWLSRFYASPVCSLTRAGLMTGRYYLRTGLYNTRFGGDTLGRDEITIAQHLKRHGYHTALFGKWHLGKYPGYRPHERGFDEFLGHYHGHIERYEFPDQLVHNGEPVEARGYVADLFTDGALEFIEAHQSEPFFCYLAYNTPHSPFLLDSSHFAQPEGDKLIEKYLKRGLPLREARIHGMVERIDSNLGRIFDRLERLKIASDTVVVFMSDNGGVSRAFQAGLRGYKGSVYEGGVRVPCLVRWPGHFPAAAVVTSQTSHVDLFATFCDLAGVELPAQRIFDGVSLRPLLESGENQRVHDYVYHTWDRYTPNDQRRWAISDGRYKLLCNGSQTRERFTARDWQLFDLQEDPGEQVNLAGQHPVKVQGLRDQFVRWFDRVVEGQQYEPVRIPVGHPDEACVELQSSWATVQGAGTNYTFAGYDWDTIDGWNRQGDAAEWRIDVIRPGRYQVRIRYGCRRADAGGVLRIGVADSQLTFTPRATPTPEVFTDAELGTLQLDAGPAVLRASAQKVPGKELMRLNRLWLKRLDP